MTAAATTGVFRAHRAQALVLTIYAKILLALAGIRGGKSETGGLWTLRNALSNPCVQDGDDFHFIFSPTYRMSKVPVGKVHKLLADKRIFPVNPLIRYAKTDRIFYLAAKGGVSRVMVLSMEDPGKARGFTARSAWFDEPSEMTEEAWTIGLGRLSDFNGPALLTGTPDGYNWVYELYERARKEMLAAVPVHQREVRVVHWTSYDNPFIDRAGLDVLARQYDAKTFEQEVMARFVRTSGLAYHAFDEEVHVVPGKFNPALELWVGQDFNVDPMCSVLGQPFKTREGLEGVHILAERRAPDSDTHQLVAWLDKFIASKRIPKSRVTVYADASGAARKTAATKSDLRILRDAGYRVVTPGRNPAVKDRVNCVNGLLRPRLLRFPRFRISPEAPESIESLKKQRWRPKTSPPELDKTQGFDHLTDGVGYLAWGRYPIKSEVTAGTQRSAA